MTEKNYNPKQKEKKAMKGQENVYKKLEEQDKKLISEDKDKKIEEQKITEKKEESEKKETEKKEEKIQREKKKKDQQKLQIKKTEAFVNVKNLPISTKQAVAICKFIKGKKIANAITNLENVLRFKKSIPMKGEIPHRKGMMSGRYPKKASQEFIKLLKSLQANANVNGLEELIIVEAIANIGSRPYGRFGRVRKKRTNVKIKIKEKIKKQEAK